MNETAKLLKYRRIRQRRKREKHIEELERGRRYRIDFFDQHGTRRREVVAGTLTDARNRLVEVLAAVKSGSYQPVRKQRELSKARATTVEHFGTRFLREYQGRSGELRSVYYQQRMVPIVAHLGRRQLADLTLADVDVLASALRDEGRSATTVNRTLTALGTVLRAAKRWGVIDALPFDPAEMRKPRPNPGRLEYLTQDEFARLLDVSEDWLRPIYRLTVACGLRVKEVTGLRWSDVELKSRTLYVNPDSKCARPDPIRLNAAAIEVLQGRQEEAAADAVYVFTNGEGADYHTVRERNRISQRTIAAMKAIGRPTCSYHSLRHTCGSWLTQAGVDLRRVQVHMRHKNIQTTQRYAHLAPEHLDDALDALDQAVSNCRLDDTLEGAAARDRPESC